MKYIRTYNSKTLVGTTIERRETYKNQGVKMRYVRTCNSKDLVGKTITRIEFYKETNKDSGEERDYEVLLLSCSDGTLYRLCRMKPLPTYYVDTSITGDIFNLLGSPIVSAREHSSFGTLEYDEEGEYGEYMECSYILGTAFWEVIIFWYTTTDGFNTGSITLEEVTT